MPIAPGLQRSKETPSHLCKYLAEELYDVRAMFWYLPGTREYGFRIVELDEPVDEQPIPIFPVRYCPWCGVELPPGLRDEWLRRLDALGLAEGSPDIPAELAGDGWWKAEGL